MNKHTLDTVKELCDKYLDEYGHGEVLIISDSVPKYPFRIGVRFMTPENYLNSEEKFLAVISLGGREGLSEKFYNSIFNTPTSWEPKPCFGIVRG